MHMQKINIRKESLSMFGASSVFIMVENWALFASER